MNNIANLPDMLGWHIGNPLGLGGIAMLLIILVLVETMSVFDYFIRHRDKPQFYPVLYSLFGVSLLAVFYYAFQADLPTINNDVKCIGWFLYISKVGIVWAILGFVLAIHVCYGLLNAMMQITAQLSVEGNLIEGKPWKEWKGGLAVLFLGLAVSGITYAAIHLWKTANSTPTETPSQPTPVSPVENDTITPAFEECPDSVSKSMSPIVYEDTELSTMLNDIAAHYQYEVIYQNENSKHVRLYFTWDKTAPIEDVIGTFNKFERIHITQENRQLIVK